MFSLIQIKGKKFMRGGEFVSLRNRKLISKLSFQLGEGDCDSDTSCAGVLECGSDNCVGESFDASDDCCYDPTSTTTTRTRHTDQLYLRVSTISSREVRKGLNN